MARKKTVSCLNSVRDYGPVYNLSSIQPDSIPIPLGLPITIDGDDNFDDRYSANRLGFLHETKADEKCSKSKADTSDKRLREIIDSNKKHSSIGWNNQNEIVMSLARRGKYNWESDETDEDDDDDWDDSVEETSFNDKEGEETYCTSFRDDGEKRTNDSSIYSNEHLIMDVDVSYDISLKPPTPPPAPSPRIPVASDRLTPRKPEIPVAPPPPPPPSKGPPKQSTQISALPPTAPQPPRAPPPPDPNAVRTNKRHKEAPKRLNSNITKELKFKVTERELVRESKRQGTRFKHLQNLFIIIQTGNDDELRAFLNRHCQAVTITPKFGCSKRHYDCKTNIVNACDMFGNTPLLLTCRMGQIRNKMTRELLRFGANPNHCDLNSDSPILYVAQAVSLDPSIDNIETLKSLLFHGADIIRAVFALCNILLTPNKESRTAMMSLTILLDPQYLLLTKDPIKTAHDCRKMLYRVAQAKEEYATDCMILADDASKFSCRFLDSCRTLWEARRVLCGSSYIENSIMSEEKNFLAHPFCQEIILEDFYGGQDYKSWKKRLRICWIFFIGVILMPLYGLGVLKNSIQSKTLRYKYSNLDYMMRELVIPVYCFLSDTVNYLIFLGLLVTVGMFIRPEEKIDDTRYRYISAPPIEIILWLSLLSRIITEMYQLFCNGFKKHFSNFWNYVDLIVCVLVTSAFGVRVYSLTIQMDSKIVEDITSAEGREKAASFKNLVLTAVYMYSIAEILVCFRLINVLDIWSFLGPLQLAVKRMLVDVAKLLILLVLILLGFIFCIYSIADCYRDVKISRENQSTSTEYAEFSTFSKTLISLTWSIFDIIGYEALVVPHDNTRIMITILVVVYMVIASVVILNMLIAMLNHTYERIQSNQDIEWKYSRAKLFSEYKKGIPAIFPFILIVSPFYISYRVYKYYYKRSKPKRKVEGGYDEWVEQEVEVDSEMAGTPKPMDGDPVKQEIKMRYLLINELAKRIKLE